MRFSPGAITYTPSRDEALANGRLRVELLDEKGECVSSVALPRDLPEKDSRAIDAFAFAVDEALRKAECRKRFPLTDGEHNRYRIEGEVREDLDDYFFRKWKGRDRYEGLGDTPLREWRMHH